MTVTYQYAEQPHPFHIVSHHAAVTVLLTRIAFSNMSHFLTECPVKCVTMSIRGHPLGVRGSPNLSLTADQGVGLRPVRTGRAVCLISQAAMFST